MEPEKKRTPVDPALRPLLSGASLFSSLLDEDLEYILSRSGIKTYQCGEFVFLTGEPSTSLFFIVSGSVVMTRKADDGAELELSHSQEGDCFGEFEFIVERNRGADAKAVSESVILQFPALQYTMDKLSLEKPDIVSRIYLKSLLLISERVESIHRLIADNASWVRGLKDQMYLDGPTGLYNKLFLSEHLAKFPMVSAVVVLLKPDRFKEINDAWGHDTGDAIMLRVAGALLKSAAAYKNAWALRLRSNETALVASVSDAEALVKTIPEEIIGRLAALPLSDITDDQCKLSFSVSAGIFRAIEHDLLSFIDILNDLLYEAWRDGGDRTYYLQSGGLGEKVDAS